jgi:hypothetical protein
MVLEILVSGLCAFVKESCALGNAKAMNIVMLKGHEQHSPRLVIESHWVKAPDAGDSQAVKDGRILQEVVDLPDGKQFFVWDLTGCRFEVVGAPSIGIFEGSRDASSTRPNEEQHAKKNLPDDFSWIPELHKTCGVPVREALAHPDTLDDTKLPSSANARMMRLTVDPTATAKDSWLDAEFNQFNQKIKDQSVYEFDTKPYRQVLADRGRLTLQLTHLPIRLRLVAYKDGSVREIQLEPPIGVSQVSMTLSNLPKSREEYNGEIKHFEAYQDILAKPLTTCAVPKEEEQHIQPVKCPICAECGGE